MSKGLLERPFWKVSLRFSLLFLGALLSILTLVHYVQNKNLDAVTQSLKEGTWKRFVIQKTSLSLIYGISMAYFLRKKEKNRQK